MLFAQTVMLGYKISTNENIFWKICISNFQSPNFMRISWRICFFPGDYEGTDHWVLQGTAPRGVQFTWFLRFSVPLFLMQQNEPFVAQDLHPHEGNSVKHRLSKTHQEL